MIKFYGYAGHHIRADKCRFHLCTALNGEYLVSTVGNMGGKDGYRNISPGYLYETMVFSMSGEDESGDPIIDLQELEYRRYNDSLEAENGHYEMMDRYMKKLLRKRPLGDQKFKIWFPSGFGKFDLRNIMRATTDAR